MTTHRRRTAPRVNVGARLADAIALEVSRGARVESQTSAMAVLVRGRRVNHVLHVILSVITLGLWVPIWLLLTLFGGEKRTILTVDEDGSSWIEKA